jgi:hypothetical protein
MNVIDIKGLRERLRHSSCLDVASSLSGHLAFSSPLALIDLHRFISNKKHRCDLPGFQISPRGAFPLSYDNLYCACTSQGSGLIDLLRCPELPTPGAYPSERESKVQCCSHFSVDSFTWRNATQRSNNRPSTSRASFAPVSLTL